jgi:hypothetical protein
MVKQGLSGKVKIWSVVKNHFFWLRYPSHDRDSKGQAAFLPVFIIIILLVGLAGVPAAIQNKQPNNKQNKKNQIISFIPHPSLPRHFTRAPGTTFPDSSGARSIL